MRRWAMGAARGAEWAGLLALLERGAGSAAQRLHVLTFHRIAEPAEDPDLHPGLISATPARFADLVRQIVRRHAVVSMEQVLDARRGARTLPPRAVLLTFDDAYRDFLAHAWPVLEAEGVPATLFVPTGFVGNEGAGFWWDRLYRAVRRAPDPAVLDPALAGRDRAACFRLLRERAKALPHPEAMEWIDRLCARFEPAESLHRVLDWPALRTLSGRGVTLCAHTRSHPRLDRLDGARLHEELAGSRRDLEREIGPTLPVVAYPSGGYDAASLEAAAREGYELGFTTDRGVVDLRRDPPLRLRRIPVSLGLPEAALRVQLLPQFAWLNPLWTSAWSA